MVKKPSIDRELLREKFLSTFNDDDYSITSPEPKDDGRERSKTETMWTN